MKQTTEPTVAYHDWNEKGFVAPYVFVMLLEWPFIPCPESSPEEWVCYHAECKTLRKWLTDRNIEEGRCNVCGTWLKNNYICKDATGRHFVTGCDCVEKIGDVDLVSKVQLEAYKHEKKLRDERKRKNAAIKAAETARLNKIREDENETKWIAENPDFVEAYSFCLTNESAWTGAKDIAGKVRAWGSLSEKQVAVLVRQLDEFKAKQTRTAVVNEAPVGKVEIVGEVVGMKWVESNFGYNTGSLKMTVIDDRGFKVFGTCPSNLQCSRGSRVKFTATVEQNPTDKTFGFFKRPTKAVCLNEVAEAVA